jgi:hypothetical protein
MEVLERFKREGAIVEQGANPFQKSHSHRFLVGLLVLKESEKSAHGLAGSATLVVMLNLE